MPKHPFRSPDWTRHQYVTHALKPPPKGVRWPRRDMIDPYTDLTKRKLFEHALACRLKQLKCDQRFRKSINVCHWGMRTQLTGCHDRENWLFSASPPIQGELETVDMIEKRFPQHLKKLFSVCFSDWLDSLLDDQPDWLQVIDSCLYNRSWPSTDW